MGLYKLLTQFPNLIFLKFILSFVVGWWPKGLCGLKLNIQSNEAYKLAAASLSPRRVNERRTSVRIGYLIPVHAGLASLWRVDT